MVAIDLVAGGTYEGFHMIIKSLILRRLQLLVVREAAEDSRHRK